MVAILQRRCIIWQREPVFSMATSCFFTDNVLFQCTGIVSIAVLWGREKEHFLYNIYFRRAFASIFFYLVI